MKETEHNDDFLISNLTVLITINAFVNDLELKLNVALCFFFLVLFMYALSTISDIG